MLVAVKGLRTDFRAEGKIPPRVVEALRRLYGQGVRVLDAEEEVVDIFGTDWYRGAKARSTPGRSLRAYRENRGLSQAELAAALGPTVRKQHISNMERGTRPISKSMAKALARVFRTSPARFI